MKTWLGLQIAAIACLFHFVGCQSEGCDQSVFPVTYQDQTFVSCLDFAQQTWCQLEDGKYVSCPDEIFSGSAQNGEDAPVVVDEPQPQNGGSEEPATTTPEPVLQPVITDVIPFEGEGADSQPEPATTPAPIPAPATNGETVDTPITEPVSPALAPVPAATPTPMPAVPAPATNGDDETPIVEVIDNCGEELGECVLINEVMAFNGKSLADGDGDDSDWIELKNEEDAPVRLLGWYLSDNADRKTKWMFPDVTIPANSFIVVFASGKDKRVPGQELHTNFKLDKDGEYLALSRPDFTIASAITPRMPPQFEDTTYGRPDVTTLDPAIITTAKYANTMTYLTSPSPGLPNSAPLLNGPIFLDTTDMVEPQPRANNDITVFADLHPNFFEITGATLFVVINFNFAKRTEIEMEKVEGKFGKYSATIPSSSFKAGDMVRWYVQAYDEGEKISRSPPFTTSEHPQYYGTVIYSEQVTSSLPVLQWFVKDSDAATSTEGARGAVFYNGYLYDNVFTRRRGITALTWTKPKLKFDFKGSVFEYDPNEKKVEEFNLQSFWREPGENSYMREVVAFQVLQEAGVPASDAFHLTVFMNNKFYGLFAFIEQVDENFLEKWNYNTAGFLYKSTHGQDTNLRWDQKLEDYEFSWRISNHQSLQNYQVIYDFTQGLAGAGPGSRAEYVMDHVNLPLIVNEMAVQTLFLNQDRCTKNFYVYYDVNTQEWSRFPWDMESAFGISSGYQGIPAPDYCILIGEQWNSPLYCNSEHPQDLVCFDPLSGSIIEPDPFKGCDNSQCGEDFIPQTLNGQLPPGFGIPQDYDEDLTQSGSFTGARGTYNHLTDAILDIPETRDMYLRRLRSVMDQFVKGGRLLQLVNETYAKIRDVADQDTDYWHEILEADPAGDQTIIHNVHNGFLQLVQEQIPKRANQLYKIYGQTGNLPFIPDEQLPEIELEILAVDSIDPDSQKHYIEIYNPNRFAVDISNWKLTGSVEYTFPFGSVIPYDYSVYVSPNVLAFRQRAESPTGNERNFVLGPWTGSLPQVGYILTLENERGLRVVQEIA